MLLFTTISMASFLVLVRFSNPIENNYVALIEYPSIKIAAIKRCLLQSEIWNIPMVISTSWSKAVMAAIANLNSNLIVIYKIINTIAILREITHSVLIHYLY